MVGVDPALVLCYRDEYQQILQNQCRPFKVLLSHEWLMQVFQTRPAIKSNQLSEWYLLGHCSETTQLPASSAEWQKIFAHFGTHLNTINVGCCGMAGTYGHELANLENSKHLYHLSWQKALASHPKDRCLTTGYSCRSQVKLFDKLTLNHPVQALLMMVS